MPAAINVSTSDTYMAVRVSKNTSTKIGTIAIGTR